MSSIIGLIQLGMFLGTLLTITFLVCLSLPASKLRDCCLWCAGWALAALSVAYALSPLDLIPFFPVDDWIVLAGGIGAAIQAWRAGNRNVERQTA